MGQEYRGGGGGGPGKGASMAGDSVTREAALFLTRFEIFQSFSNVEGRIGMYWLNLNRNPFGFFEILQ